MTRAKVVRIYQDEHGVISWPEMVVPDGVLVEVTTFGDLDSTRVYSSSGSYSLAWPGLGE